MSESPNREITTMLLEFAKIYDVLGDVFKSKAYNAAAATIAKLTYKLTRANLDQFLDDPCCKPRGIGKGISSRIREFIETRKVVDLDKLKESREYTAYTEFTRIIGVGPATARKWLSMGIDNLLKLRQAVANDRVELTHAQKLGMVYYVDLNQRIPRPEVATIGAKMRTYINLLSRDNKFEIVGSYRRGAESSGDVDCVFTTERFDPKIITRLVDLLETDTNFIDVLSQGEQKITFLYRGKAVVRQVDIFYAQPSEYIPHILYATGSAEHNEYVRGVAKQKGYRLNQIGLFKITRGNNMKKITLHTERELYDILKIPYVEPKDR
ncbi:DNA polymerase beta family protein [Faustovirus]|nr:DNA polymerase beta family protein [Faustovirus]AMN84798.1 DNA polymerase beta family protein [Faustovirus]AMP44070.1 DNA polymerase beta family protein [Faustovirus]